MSNEKLAGLLGWKYYETLGWNLKKGSWITVYDWTPTTNLNQITDYFVPVLNRMGWQVDLHNEYNAKESYCQTVIARHYRIEGLVVIDSSHGPTPSIRMADALSKVIQVVAREHSIEWLKAVESLGGK